jgi:hypothetical protein
MVAQQEVFINGIMVSLVALHIFGGEKPLVSKTVADAVGIIKICSLMTTLAVEPVLRAPPKCKKIAEEKVSSSVNMNCTVARVVAGCLAILAAGRLLRSLGILTSVHAAIQLALLLGCLARYVLDRLRVQHTSPERFNDFNEDFFLDPEDYCDWTDIDPLESTPTDEVVPDSKDITADMCLRLAF